MLIAEKSTLCDTPLLPMPLGQRDIEEAGKTEEGRGFLLVLFYFVVIFEVFVCLVG